MVKIIGSSKIDDYRKVTLEEGVMRSINVKPGDSVLFYKKENDSSLCMFKAEGAHVTDECDTPMRAHMKELPRKLRMMLFVAAGAVTLLLFALLFNLKDIGGISLYVGIIVWLIAAAAMVAAIKTSDKIDEPFETQSLVSVAGPYGKNRVAGMSKLTDDGYIVSGDLFVNCLFGANPKKVEATLVTDGDSEPVLTKCTKAVPGYSVHKLRFKNELLADGQLKIRLTYAYTGKTIVVDAVFDVVAKNKGGVELREGPVSATFAFDKTLNQSEFDDALFDPTDDEAVI